MMTNNQLSRCQQSTVFVVETHETWSAAIASGLPDIKVSRLFQIQDLLSQCGQTHGSLAVIEIDLSKRLRTAKNDLLDLNLAVQRQTDCPFFAVGQSGLAAYRNQLLTVGFTEVFGGLSTVTRMLRLARRYFSTVAWPDMSVEQRVLHSLPWQASDASHPLLAPDTSEQQFSSE